MFTPSFSGSTVCRLGLHNSCVLVHRVNLVRQSGRHNRALVDRHFRWHSACRCSRVCRRAVRWRHGSNVPVPLDGSNAARNRGTCRGTAFRSVKMKTVLFACVHNAGRSQMAAAWFNQIADPTKARAISAGTSPGPHVHPEVVTAMREVGIDLAAAFTTKLTPELAQQTQVLVTMGCGDECPYVPGVKRDD